MNRFYLRGRDKEYRLRKKFRKQGYLVLRCAASRPIDLVLLKKGCCKCGMERSEIRLIESKLGKRKYVKPTQRAEFERIEKLTGIKVEVV